MRTEIANLDTRLSTQIAEVRSDIGNLEARLIKWIIATVVATASVTVAIAGVVVGVSASPCRVAADDAPHRPMMLTQTSDADPFIVCAIPDYPRDLDPRTIEAAYEDDAHYLGTLPAEYHLDIEQRELTKHPPAVDQVNDLLATLGFAAVQPFTAIAWTNRHEQPVVLVVAEQDRLPIGQCDHGLRQTITRRPFRGPVAHSGNPDARDGHTELENCTHCGALRVVNVGPADAREATAWVDPAPHHRTLAWSGLYRVLVGPQREDGMDASLPLMSVSPAGEGGPPPEPTASNEELDDSFGGRRCR